MFNQNDTALKTTRASVRNQKLQENMLGLDKQRSSLQPDMREIGLNNLDAQFNHTKRYLRRNQAPVYYGNPCRPYTKRVNSKYLLFALINLEMSRAAENDPLLKSLLQINKTQEAAQQKPGSHIVLQSLNKKKVKQGVSKGSKKIKKKRVRRMQRNKLGDSQSSLSVSDNISQKNNKKDILSFQDLVRKHQSCKTTVTTADLYMDVTDTVAKFPERNMERNFQNFKRILKYKYQKFVCNQSKEQSRMSLELP